MSDDRFANDPNKYQRDFKSKTQQVIEDRSKQINPGDEIRSFQQEIQSDREKDQLKSDQEKFEPTKEKKRTYGPFQGLYNLLPWTENTDTKGEKIDSSPAASMELEGLTLSDVIAPIDMEIDFNNVQVGDMFYRTYFVKDYPRFVGPNWLSPIINFEHSLFISTFYYPVDSKVILQKLKRKIGEMEATLYSQMEGRKAVDPSLKVALTDAQQLQDSIAEGTEKFFHFGMYITIKARDKDTLDKIGKNVQSTLASINVTAKIATLEQEQGLISVQPLGLDRIYETRNMDTTSLATTFPFVTSELTMDRGIMYGINQHNKSLVIFDRFSLENANSVVFATSGAGKSYFVKLEAVRNMMLGSEILIIDPEREYERLCEAVGGSYISFSQDQGAKMNPFELSGMGDDSDELRMKMLSLQGFFKIMFGKLTNIELAILDRALILTYREKGITLDPATQKDADYPLLEDLYKVLKGMAESEARSLSSRLERYIIGSGAGVFNMASTVQLNNPFTVFSIRDMPEELRPMAMYLMLDYIWTKIRTDQRRRILVVDEAWYMMQNEDSAKFMYGIAKRARKYYLGLTTITQDVEDFLHDDKGRAIVTNSAMQFLMKQSPSAVDRLVDVFNLSQGEKQFLLSADRGQGLFFAGSNHVAIQVVSSQAEHELITSDPKDLERMRQQETQTGERSIQELAQLYAPPAQQDPIKNQVNVNRGVIEKAVESRKQQINDMVENNLRQNQAPQGSAQPGGKSYEERLRENSERFAQPQQTTSNETYFDDLEPSLTDQIRQERERLQKGKSHMTPQGIVGDIDEDDEQIKN